MFVQVITGKTSKAAEVRAAVDRWEKDLAPGAEGWLGSTAGVTEDGRLVALARFESEEAAQRNSDRPEQGEWWAEVAKLLDGEATFRNSVNVMPDLRGDPDQARLRPGHAGAARAGSEARPGVDEPEPR